MVVISLMVGMPIGMSGACVVMVVEECREETDSLRIELPLYLVDELTLRMQLCCCLPLGDAISTTSHA